VNWLPQATSANLFPRKKSGPQFSPPTRDPAPGPRRSRNESGSNGLFPSSVLHHGSQEFPKSRSLNRVVR